LNNDKKSSFSTPAVLPSVARRESERSEGDRGATEGKTTAPPEVRPNPEVVAQAKRRRYTAEYKQRILAEADQARDSGGIGALLRREGLYSSALVSWRRERAAGILQGLSSQRRGPKVKRDAAAIEMQQLRSENLRLSEELRKADIVIDIQKKVAALLGRPFPAPDPTENP
jgi:transposase-like protein